MAKNVRVVLNQRGLIALLKSPEVTADLAARAERIARAAGKGMEVEQATGRNRARAVVVTASPAAMKAEAQDRALSSAINAGR